jgi:hypothetical protein
MVRNPKVRRNSVYILKSLRLTLRFFYIYVSNALTPQFTSPGYNFIFILHSFLRNDEFIREITTMKKIVDYVLKNYRLFYQTDENVNWGNSNDEGINIEQHVTGSFFENRQDVDPEKVVWKEWKGRKIPFCFDFDDKKEIITRTDNQVSINYDIIASSFYFLSGWNEYVNPHKDEFGRVLYEQSIIKKLNIAGLPVVNYYFDILNEAVFLMTGKNSKKKIWPENDFGVALTHDIDVCKSAWLEGSYSELKKKHLRSIPSLIFKRLFANDDWFNFKLISDLEKEYNASSSFYFLPRKGKAGKWKNSDYDVRSNGIQKAMKFLEQRGHDIGVHGSFGTHDDANNLAADMNRINVPGIIGNRFHFLLFDAGKSVDVLEKSGIRYDTSLGFAEQTGFRRGTCFPYYLYNFATGNSSKVLEIPLIMMDATLQKTDYMGITQDEAEKQVELLIDEIKKFNGVFTILWHNTFFSDYKYTGWKEVYVKILEYCKEKNALLTNASNIYRLTINA